MFNFFEMGNNYEERKVANDKVNGAVIDTVSVTDSDQPYETGVSHKKYDNGSWVIVEMHNDLESAKIGHKQWLEIFSKKELPKELLDVGTSEIAKLMNVFC